jgi:hypothetical protein
MVSPFPVRDDIDATVANDVVSLMVVPDFTVGKRPG